MIMIMKRSGASVLSACSVDIRHFVIVIFYKAINYHGRNSTRWSNNEADAHPLVGPLGSSLLFSTFSYWNLLVTLLVDQPC